MNLHEIECLIAKYERKLGIIKRIKRNKDLLNNLKDDKLRLLNNNLRHFHNVERLTDVILSGRKLSVEEKASIIINYSNEREPICEAITHYF